MKIKDKSVKILYAMCDINSIARDGIISDEYIEQPDKLNQQKLCEIKIIQPFFSEIDSSDYKLSKLKESREIYIENKKYNIEFYKTIHKTGIEIILIKNIELFCNYSEHVRRDKEDPENILPIAFFNHAVIQYLLCDIYQPDILNCCGWETGLIPLLKNEIFVSTKKLKKMQVSFSVFNLSSQGVYDQKFFSRLAVPWSFFNVQELEFWGRFSFLKSGLLFSDAIILLGFSKKDNIFDEDFSCGLGGVMANCYKKISYVPIGVDKRWNPIYDPYLLHNYTLNTISEKKKNKDKFLKKIKFHCKDKDKPLVAIFGYLTPFQEDINFEKFFDVISELEANFVIIGETNQKIFEICNDCNDQLLDNCHFVSSYDNCFIHQMLGSVDMILLPSYNKFFPFIHLYALQYGTVSIISKYFANSFAVSDFQKNQSIGNGFIINGKSLYAVLAKLISAINMVYFENKYIKIIKNMSACNLEWNMTLDKLHKIFFKLKR